MTLYIRPVANANWNQPLVKHIESKSESSAIWSWAEFGTIILDCALEIAGVSKSEWSDDDHDNNKEYDGPPPDPPSPWLAFSALTMGGTCQQTLAPALWMVVKKLTMLLWFLTYDFCTTFTLVVVDKKIGCATNTMWYSCAHIYPTSDFLGPQQCMKNLLAVI